MNNKNIYRLFYLKKIAAIIKCVHLLIKEL